MSEKITVATGPLTPEERNQMNTFFAALSDRMTSNMRSPLAAPLLAAGWEIEPAGGGNTVWSKYRDDIGVWLTDGSGLDTNLEDPHDGFMIGHYNSDGELIRKAYFATLDEALGLLRAEGWL